MSHVLGLPVAAQEYACLDVVTRQITYLLRHFGFDHSGRDAVYRDLARGQLHRHGPREGIDRPFAGGVIRLAAAALFRRHGAQVDDATRKKAYETIEKNANIQTKLINDLVDSTRVATGKIKLSSDQVPAPIMETAPGTPFGCKAWQYTPAQAAAATIGERSQPSHG